AASRYAVTTQERSANPPSEATIAGSALARIVWSTAARNIANITPGKTRRNAARNSSAPSGMGLVLAWGRSSTVLRLDQSVSNGDQREFCRVGYPELLLDVVQMRADRARRQ